VLSSYFLFKKYVVYYTSSLWVEEEQTQYTPT